MKRRYQPCNVSHPTIGAGVRCVMDVKHHTGPHWDGQRLEWPKRGDR